MDDANLYKSELFPAHGFDPDVDSVSSYDFIPSPHNKFASINGAPQWHQDYWCTPLLNNSNCISIGTQPSRDVLAYHNAYGEEGSTWNESPTTSLVGWPSRTRFSLSHNQIYWVLRSPDYDYNDSQRQHPISALDALHSMSAPTFMYPPPFNQNLPQFGTTMSNSVAAQLIPSQPPYPFVFGQHPIEDIVTELLNPPPSWGDRENWVTIGLPWVMRTVGPRHMEYSTELSRIVLRNDSELNVRGEALGMPADYLAWLRGDPTFRTNTFTIKRIRLFIPTQW